MYEPRTYRVSMGNRRFQTFAITHRETDLWIAVDRSVDIFAIEKCALSYIKSLRQTLETYIKQNPAFATTLDPIEVATTAPAVVTQMAAAANIAGTGPMAAVAGAFAQLTGKYLETEFALNELIIENGGDIYLNIKEKILISVYAGKSSLSEKLGIWVTPTYSPLGVCTSSGTVGHSFSRGRADAVTIACSNTMLADAFATAFGNRVQSSADIDSIINETSKYEEILSAIIICNDKIGIRSDFEIKLLK